MNYKIVMLVHTRCLKILAWEAVVTWMSWSGKDYATACIYICKFWHLSSTTDWAVDLKSFVRCVAVVLRMKDLPFVLSLFSEYEYGWKCVSDNYKIGFCRRFLEATRLKNALDEIKGTDGRMKKKSRVCFTPVNKATCRTIAVACRISMHA